MGGCYGRRLIRRILQDVLFRISLGAGKGILGVHVAGNSEDVVVLRAGKFILRCNDFDVVRRARLKSILRKLEFTLRETLSLFGDGDLLRGGVEIQECFTNVFINSAS